MKVYDQHAVGVFECLWMNQKHEGRIHVMITRGVTHFGNQKIYRYYSKEPKIQWDFMCVHLEYWYWAVARYVSTRCPLHCDCFHIEWFCRMKRLCIDFISVWSHVLLDTKSCTPAPYWGVELERSPQCSICVAAISYVMRLSAALTSYLIGRLRIRKPYTKFQFSPAIYIRISYLFEMILSCSFHVKIHNSQSWWFKCNIHIGNR